MRFHRDGAAALSSQKDTAATARFLCSATRRALPDGIATGVIIVG
jgi:hypothetical protein